MSVEQYQRSVNSLDREIASLEKKKSEIDKKCAELNKKIAAAKNSITSHTPASTVKSKLRQVSSWQTDCSRKSAESASLGAKIADKKHKRNDAYLKLQKAQQTEQKKQAKQNLQIQENYEKRIAELQELSRIVPVHNTQDQTNQESVVEEYDVFVSHAWEDKTTFVDEFVNELNALGIKVWYDTSEIKWGDSMRKKIDDGLKKSRFGVVVLSPDYIKDGKYWTKAELDGLFQIESINGKTLLPIWHNLTKKDVIEYSPIIANKLAMTTATMTPTEIAEELFKLLPKEVVEE